MTSSAQNRKNENQEWYAKLAKPSFAPPSWLFGVVWTLLYGVIGFSFLFVVRRIFDGSVPARAALPMALNLVFNLAFTPIQFRLKNNALALADAVLVVLSLLWFLIVIFPYYPIVAYVNAPYLLWGIFACVLQAAIVRLNRART